MNKKNTRLLRDKEIRTGEKRTNAGDNNNNKEEREKKKRESAKIKRRVDLQVNLLDILGSKILSAGWTFPLTELELVIHTVLAKDVHAPQDHMRLEVYVTGRAFQQLQVSCSLFGRLGMLHRARLGFDVLFNLALH